MCSWAPGAECGEEGTDIEEVEGAVVVEVGNRVHRAKCHEEGGDIEEVERAIAGQIWSTGGP